ncbi:MAG: LptA/OstA family protein, partial [Spirochaetaceae bacterium]|nr:LptA/OstA family protein [Spirochaetaceae bacterium]
MGMFRQQVVNTLRVFAKTQVTLFIFLTLLSLPFSAQTPGNDVLSSEVLEESSILQEQESEPDVIYFKADRMNGSVASDSEYTKLTGSAWIESSALEVYADTIELSDTNFRYIIAFGGIRGRELESGFDFTCNSLRYDRKTKIALLEGDVTMDDPDNEVVAAASRIEYDQNTETAVMQIDVHITQKTTVCTSAFAVYRRKDEMLELMGNPIVVRESDTFRGQ